MYASGSFHLINFGEITVSVMILLPIPGQKLIPVLLKRRFIKK